MENNSIIKFIINWERKIGYIFLAITLAIIILLFINIPLKFWDENIIDFLDKFLIRILILIGILSLFSSAMIDVIEKKRLKEKGNRELIL